MKVMVVGGGGREHALCWGLKRSPEVEKVYCVPGNPGIAGVAECLSVKNSADMNELAALAVEKQVGLVVVGPEVPLCQGAADAVRAKGIPVFGPSRDGARLEGSKDFSKQFMVKYGIPTARYQTFTDAASALEYVRAEYAAGRAVVVKADGLAAGKGVIVAKDCAEAQEAVRECFDGLFGAAGARVVIEELLIGEEASILALTDGKNIVPLASSQDHKRLLDGDNGPNTGGMGAYSPAPVVTDALMSQVDREVLQPFLRGVQEEGFDYRGIIYAGIMVTKNGPKVLEFNVRFGDPETEAIVPRFKSSLFDALYKTAQARLSEAVIEWTAAPAVCVVLASGGYPAGPIDKGHEIRGIAEAEQSGAIVFHAGTAVKDGKLVNAGGRCLVVAKAGSEPDIRSCIASVYESVAQISWTGMQYRKDIARRAVDRKS